MEEKKLYTREEVSIHNSAKDVWVIYNKKVLDVTWFIRDHPGGEDVILEYSGQDLTQAFEDIGHSEKAVELMNKYWVGRVDTSPIAPAAPKRITPSTTKTPENAFQSLLLPILVIVLSIIAYFYFA